MKHLITTTLLLVASLLLPPTAHAYDFEVNGIYYNIINNNEAEVTQSESEERYTGDVTIPASVTYNSATYSVTTIGEWAFSSCSELTSITIPNSVTTIGDYAFSWCGLTSIDIPSSVITLGGSVFLGCTELSSIDIPNSLTTISGSAFSECTGLTSVTIPNSVTTIGSCAFLDCYRLTCITIPNSVTTIGNDAFWGCNNLKTVFLTGDGEWIAGELPNTAATLYIDNGITGVKGMKEKPSDVFSFSVTPPTCDENSFTDYSGTLHVPSASLAAYFTAPYWCNFTNIVGDAVKLDGLSLNQDSLDLVVSEMTTLETTISPALATSNIITWVSSNPDVATVVNGMVTAISDGECDIFAMCLDKNAVCHVYVYSDRISLDKPEAQVLPNHIVTITPTSLSDELPTLLVTTSDPTVSAARVMNGKVQVVGVSEGTATITVSSADGSAKPASCLITVYTEMGDTNCDGFVNVTDVTTLIDKILGNDEKPFKDSNADLNGDGLLNVSDVTTLIRLILNN